MVTGLTLRRALLGRDVAVAYAIIAVLYLAKFIEVRLVQIPAYLLIVAYDIVEVGIPALTPYYPVGFPLFLYLLAIVGAGAARWLRPMGMDESAWIQTLGGVCLVIGVLSLLFGAFVGGPLVSPTDNPTPLAVTSATGVAFLLGGGWLLGRPSD